MELIIFSICLSCRECLAGLCLSSLVDTDLIVCCWAMSPWHFVVVYDDTTHIWAGYKWRCDLWMPCLYDEATSDKFIFNLIIQCSSMYQHRAAPTSDKKFWWYSLGDEYWFSCFLSSILALSTDLKRIWIHTVYSGISEQIKSLQFVGQAAEFKLSLGLRL